jgi:hypothetical protein
VVVAANRSRGVAFRALRWLAGPGLLLLLAANLGFEARAQQLPGELRPLSLDRGITLRYFAPWTYAERYFSNAVEFQAPGGRARTLVTAEEEQDHAGALRRLSEIAAEVAAPAQFLSIGGWPALERHYLFTRGQTGQLALSREENRAWRITTAIAAGAVLVRFETTYKAETQSPFGMQLKDRIVAQAALIGRMTIAPRRGASEETLSEIEALRRSLPSTGQQAPEPAESRGSRERGAARKAHGPVPQGVPLGLKNGEIEIAASRDGKHVLIVANSGFAVSNNGGPFAVRQWDDTRKPRVGPFPFRDRGDPSAAIGKSRAFYYAYIGVPNGEPAAGGVTGCSTAIGKSIDDGRKFHFLSHAGLCPATGSAKCLPDQAHIAADQTNAGVGGADQLYSVYRSCSGLGTEQTCEQTTTWCRGKPSIVCSKDGGTSWTQPLLIENSGSADFPRISVGADGFVYVIYRNGNLLKLAKFSSCVSGLVRQPGFPIIIPMAKMRRCPDDQGIDRCHCPVAGLDRCNNGNLLSSPTVAPDDSDPSRIYVAYAVNTSARNDDIVVRASTDGGLTWPQETTINEAVAARRFMPWLCTMNGRAHVTWYDRGAATGADNSLTNYLLGSAGLTGGRFTVSSVRNLSGMSDPHCGYWPSAPRSADDSESCQIQPQWAGNCEGRNPTSDRVQCDFGCGPGACASCRLEAHMCKTGPGVPKYGDYSGNACAAGKIFAAWASRTPPRGPRPAPSDRTTPIQIFATAIAADP